MGVLTDDPAPPPIRGEGQKFVDLFAGLDQDDRDLIRKWDEDPLVTTNEIARRVIAKFPIGRSSVERGLARLRSNEWEC